MTTTIRTCFICCPAHIRQCLTLCQTFCSEGCSAVSVRIQGYRHLWNINFIFQKAPLRKKNSGSGLGGVRPGDRGSKEVDPHAKPWFSHLRTFWLNVIGFDFSVQMQRVFTNLLYYMLLKLMVGGSFSNYLQNSCWNGYRRFLNETLKKKKKFYLCYRVNISTAVLYKNDTGSGLCVVTVHSSCQQKHSAYKTSIYREFKSMFFCFVFFPLHYFLEESRSADLHRWRRIYSVKLFLGIQQSFSV